MSPVPIPILKALNLPTDPQNCTLDSSGLGSGFTSTAILNATTTSETNTHQQRKYFIKTSQDGPAAKEMFHGEYESLNAIADAVPGFCPRALAWGPLDEKNGYFLATEFLDLRSSRNRGSSGDEMNSLAYRLGKLHTTPAPVDPVTGRSRYGFPVPTFCGDTRQSNTFYDSWADFYANERLLTILASSEKRNGRDAGLRDLVEKTARIVVPRLLGDEHLGYNIHGEGVGLQPVVVHGDLWSGNADRGRIVGNGNERDEEEEEVVVGDVVYDPSACYAHSEFELGIMGMFGGFGGRFFEDYHRIVPRTEPVEEYEDRVRLYEL
ncbi:Ketosamine-3-kinase [Penicillium subrubescens]|uniref:protein-ribulosamine 3-kinase n=2 Tax=Penicillium subrubescens TaxID=1316194 RepID=A0A1Q5SUI6_9EURO|nr:Ketosamine-3-kinase [Penicillium subrubescens]